VPEIIFAFDEGNFRHCQDQYRGARDQDYYGGDYEIESASALEVQAEKQVVGPFSVNRLRSTTKLTFRRSWRHIREDGADLAILWFVKNGELVLDHSQGRRLARPGDCLFTRSAAPFLIECLPGEDGRHETLHVVMPGHVLDRLRPDGVRTGVMLSAQSGEVFVAEQVFSALFTAPAAVAAEAAEQLVMDALTMVVRSLQIAPPVRRRKALGQRRLAEIRNFVDLHLANPLLCAAMTAKGCGISQRYLSHLLKSHGTSFSRLLWTRRLEMAGERLGDADAGDLLVGDVALGLGFKSAAHFSRMFKRAFGETPVAFKRRASADTAASGARH
jgi:AraC family transcriptional activator of tynA and feaB